MPNGRCVWDELRTFRDLVRPVALVHVPQAQARGLAGLSHFVDGPRIICVIMMPRPSVDKAPVPGLVGVDVAVVHEGDEVPRGALLPRGQARHFLT